MSDAARPADVVDDPAAVVIQLGAVRFHSPQSLAEAIQWLMASPALEAMAGARMPADLHIEGTIKRGTAVLVHYNRAWFEGFPSADNRDDAYILRIIPELPPAAP